MEFRCFIKEDRLVAVSQRHCNQVHADSEWERERERERERVSERGTSIFPDNNYLLEVLHLMRSAWRPFPSASAPRCVGKNRRQIISLVAVSHVF